MTLESIHGESQLIYRSQINKKNYYAGSSTAKNCRHIYSFFIPVSIEVGEKIGTDYFFQLAGVGSTTEVLGRFTNVQKKKIKNFFGEYEGETQRNGTLLVPNIGLGISAGYEHFNIKFKIKPKSQTVMNEYVFYNGLSSSQDQSSWKQGTEELPLEDILENQI